MSTARRRPVDAAEAPPDWDAAQDALADAAVRLALERSGEAGVRLRAAGIAHPETRGMAGLREVAVLAKDDLPDLQAAQPPFGGMLGVDLGVLRRIHRSPGPINDPEGQRSDYWRMAPAFRAAGFERGDVVLNTFSYHLTPGGHMMDAGLRAVGCVVVAGGVGNTSAQAAFASQVGAAGYVGTPQFLLTLLDRGRDEGIRSTFRRALVSGAPLPHDLRRLLEEGHGVSVFQAYGTADAGAIGYECEAKDGWHVAPGIVVEVLDPGTREPCEPGGPGEVVVTSANPVYPLVRFGTGDLSAFRPDACDCGRTSPRLAGFLGRTGEGVKVRGMFVHPRQLAEALVGAPGVRRYQGAVTEQDHRDILTVSIEPRGDRLPDLDELAARLREVTRLRVEVRTVEPGTIPEDATPIIDLRERSPG
ncbi:AMP-binding protein [Candidatus Palauibacter soopunensis]|uniref:phenylacetate--CoA ligase family protein n=1 Tax=Candidatus Palauibacter soopunensis TaxID=3056739 RepID=UPI002382B57B|nr:AMP-binding protein [Candidatus Palauibacter soopunensis]MDE2877938.1 AMP-binding protein [Candidatus Palauibacter soopunensis]